MPTLPKTYSQNDVRKRYRVGRSTYYRYVRPLLPPPDIQIGTIPFWFGPSLRAVDRKIIALTRAKQQAAE